MTFPFFRRRYHSGGIVRGSTLRPDEIPVLIPRRQHTAIPAPTADLSKGFADVDELLGAEGRAIMDRVIESAMREATARAVALDLVRRFGVSLPLKALRARPRPMLWIEAMVLAKLEGVAEHLGAP